MLDKIEIVHHHELISFAAHSDFIRFEFGPAIIAMKEFEVISPRGSVEATVRIQDASSNLDVLSRLVGKCMQRCILDYDSFRLIFDDWTILRQKFGLTDSLVEIWGPEPNAFTSYPQVVLDLNPEAKRMVEALKRQQLAVDAYIASEGQNLSHQSSQILRRLHKRFSKPPNHNLTDFLYEYGSVQGALLHARLFVPEFRVIAGRVILDDGYAPEAYLKAVSKSETGSVDPDSFNYVEVFYMFADRETGIDIHNYDDDEVLAELIAEAWRCRLAALFPERKFVVDVTPGDESGLVTTVGFREVTP
jgi:hypothetical protein